MSPHPGLGAWRKQRGVASEVTLSEWAPGAGVKPEREDRACHRGVAVRNLILFAIDLERTCAMLSHPTATHTWSNGPPTTCTLEMLHLPWKYEWGAKEEAV